MTGSILAAIAMLGGIAATAQAALHAPVNGQIYDDVLDVSWLQDANVFKTLCDANDPIAMDFVPVDRTAAQICSDGGGMTWNDAMAWIDRLNTSTYLGHDDWRLPTVDPIDGVIHDFVLSYDGSTDNGYNVGGPGGAFPGSTASELAYMHFTNLGNGSLFDPVGNDQSALVCPGLEGCLQATGPFQNLQPDAYWAGTTAVAGTGWYFSVYNGQQYYHNFNMGRLFAWPVRDGQTFAAAHVPALSPQARSLSVLLLAAMAFFFLLRRRTRA